MSTRDSFNFSWEDVSRGFWKRYPNPNAKHVLSEDTISRYITREGSYEVFLYSERYRLPVAEDIQRMTATIYLQCFQVR